jgi:hypothetical protein
LLPLHTLFFTTKANPSSVETVNPTCQRSNYIPSFSTYILSNKPAALALSILTHERASYLVYCDGSGFEGGAGASAVLYHNSQEVKLLHYHLGSMKEYTVYKAEIVGLSLGLHLLISLNKCTSV